MNVALNVLLVLACVAPAQAGETNPISKVIQMLSELETKVIAEGESSQKIYAEAAEWCEDRSRAVGFEIKTGQAEVADLTATIDQQTSVQGSLTAKIDELAGEIATDEADLKAATEIRHKEAVDFAAE